MSSEAAPALRCSPLPDAPSQPPVVPLARGGEDGDAPGHAALPQLAEPAARLSHSVQELKQDKVKVDNLVGNPGHLWNLEAMSCHHQFSVS